MRSQKESDRDKREKEGETIGVKGGEQTEREKEGWKEYKNWNGGRETER